MAVNHFYDGPYTTTEYRTRGSRLTNMVSRISVGLETYDSEYGTLMQMASAYGDKLKSAKGLIDERMDALADYNSKKKAATSAAGKEGKDPAKLKAAQDKFTAAKDAFESADAKATRELTSIFEDACSEFEECYSKFLRVQSSLFATAAAALGGAELPTSTMQYSVTGSDDAPSKVYKGELKEEKKREKKEKKEEKKEEKRKRRGTVATAPSHASRNDVFEPSDDRYDEPEMPPPSLSTPPMELKSPRTSNQQRSSMAMASGGPPPLPSGRPAPPPTANYYDGYDSTPVLPPRADSGEIVTGLDLIGREPQPAPTSPRRPLPSAPAPEFTSSYDAPPPSLPGRPKPAPPTDNEYGAFDTSPRGGPPPLPSYNAGGPPALPPSNTSSNASSGGPPPLPAQNNNGPPPSLPNSRPHATSDAPPPSLPPSRYRSGSVSQNEPPSLPERAPSGTLASPGRPSLPPLSPSTAASTEQKPSSGKLPSPRHGIQVLPPMPATAAVQDSPQGGPPSLPGRARAPSTSSAPASGPPALPSGRGAAPPSLPPSNGAAFNHSNEPPSLPGRAPSGSLSSTAAPPKIPPSQPQYDSFNPRADPVPIIPVDEIGKYGLIFKREDAEASGYITGKQAFTLFSRSKLPSLELAQIWELSDQDKDGQLTKDEFIIAMWYINSRLKQQIAVVPKDVHPSLVLKQYPGSKLPGSS